MLEKDFNFKSQPNQLPIIVTILLYFGGYTIENLYTLNYGRNLSLTINIVTCYY